MRNKIVWLTLSCLLIFTLLVTSCKQQQATPSEGKTVAGKVEEQKPTTAPAKPTTATTSAKEMVLDPATKKMVTKPEYGGTITYVGGTDPAYIDPWNGSAGVGVASMFLEKLAIANWAVDRNIFPWQSTSYFPESIYIGQLAESWDVVSPTKWIIHIRQGIRWQNKPPMNGREMTAADVKWSYDRTCGTGSGFTKATPNATGMLGIPWDSFTVIDKNTLEVKLKSPVLTALKIFLNESYEGSWVYPREVIEKYGNLNDWRTVVGTGPFMIDDHVVDSSWTWAKNPDYWGHDEKWPENKIPYVDKVRWIVIPEFQTQLAALRAGKIVYLGTNITNAKTIRTSNPELVEYRFKPGSGPTYPLDATKAPLDDIRVRTAMQMAINLQEIAATYYEGLADPTPFGQLGSACAGYYIPYKDWPEDLKASYAYNPKKAKELMTEAGFPKGFKIIFNLFPSWANADVLQIVQGYWKEIGIELDIKTFDWAAYSGKVFSKSAGPIGSWYGAVNYEPMAWMKVQYYSKNPWSFPVGDPAYDAMVDKADVAPTLEEQKKLIQECDMYSIGKHWQIVLPFVPGFGFSQPWYKGWNGESFSLGGGLLNAMSARLWIDRDLKFKMTGLRD